MLGTSTLCLAACGQAEPAAGDLAQEADAAELAERAEAEALDREAEAMRRAHAMDAPERSSDDDWGS